MAFLGPFGALFGVAGLLGSQLAKGPGKPPAPLPTVTRDTARDQAMANDELLRRRGGAADILNGASGAEPAQATGKATLGT